jgi:DNA-binding response OmpR family regulator
VEHEGAKILIIDDEPDIRTFLEDLLNMQGYRCETAESGAVGLVKLGAAEPDIVLLDIMMPGMSGFDVLKSIRARDGAGPAVVMISCLSHHNTTQRAMEEGADRFVMKPFRVTELLGTLQQVLQDRAEATG